MVAVQSRLNDTNEYCKQKEQVLHTEIAFSYHPLSFLTTFFRLLSSVYSLLSLITSTLLLVLIHLLITIPISVILLFSSCLSSPFHYYASFQKPTYIPVLLLIHFFHPPFSPPLPHLLSSPSSLFLVFVMVPSLLPIPLLFLFFFPLNFSPLPYLYFSSFQSPNISSPLYPSSSLHQPVTVIILGAFGGRLDQEIANIHALYKWHSSFHRIVLLGIKLYMF